MVPPWPACQKWSGCSTGPTGPACPSAEVRFESGRVALLIAPGGHYRMEHQDEDGLVEGNDGQRGWTW